MTCPACAGTGRVTFPDGDGCACDGCDATGYQDEQHQRIVTALDGPVRSRIAAPSQRTMWDFTPKGK